MRTVLQSIWGQKVGVAGGVGIFLLVFFILFFDTLFVVNLDPIASIRFIPHSVDLLRCTPTAYARDNVASLLPTHLRRTRCARSPSPLRRLPLGRRRTVRRSR